MLRLSGPGRKYGDVGGEEFSGAIHVKLLGHTFSEMVSTYHDFMELQPGGWAVDKKFPEVIYVPEGADDAKPQ